MNAAAPFQSIPNPEPRTLNPQLPLPPTTRDFEIHRAHLVEHVSTRSLADKHDISQTRVRQVVNRVTQWLLTALPLGTEAELEREALLARRLAADQLNHQIERLETLWTATCDPKYFRQQARAILSLGRLGVVPGAIDALAADAADPAEAASGVQSRGTREAGLSNVQSQDESGGTLDFGPGTLDLNSPPPPGDCSQDADRVPADSSHPSHDAAASPTRAARSGNSPTSLRDQIEGLKIIEQRLLTFFDYLAPSDSEGRRNLEARIAKIRRARDEAIAELRVSPHALGAVLRLNELFHPNLHETAAPRTHGSRDFEQEQTEATQRNDACDASTV